MAILKIFLNLEQKNFLEIKLAIINLRPYLINERFLNRLS
jgi:hypothetical protein